MDTPEVSQNVILAVMAAPLLAALVDLIKRRGPVWANDGMMPALIAEVLGSLLGVLAYATSGWLYSVPGTPFVPQAPPAYYLASGFLIGLTAVGLQSQFRSAFKDDGPIPLQEKEKLQ